MSKHNDAQGGLDVANGKIAKAAVGTPVVAQQGATIPSNASVAALAQVTPVSLANTDMAAVSAALSAAEAEAFASFVKKKDEEEEGTEGARDGELEYVAVDAATVADSAEYGLAQTDGAAAQETSAQAGTSSAPQEAGAGASSGTGAAGGGIGSVMSYAIPALAVAGLGVGVASASESSGDDGENDDNGAPNGPPNFSDSQELQVDEDSSVDFSIAADDPDGDALEIEFSGLNNGDVTENGNGGYTFTPDADFEGTETFTATVSDGRGGTATQTITVTVNGVNDAPTFAEETKELAVDEDDAEGVALELDATDVDQDTVTYTFAQNGETIENDEDGVFALDNGTIVPEGGGFVFVPAADFTGDVTFTAIAADAEGAQATQEITVAVAPTNDAPEAGEPKTVALDEDASASFTIDAADPDGDELTVTIAEPENGTIADNGDGTFTFSPDESWSGTETVAATITDRDGGTATQEITFEVAPVNDLPTVDPATQTVEVNEGEAVAFDAAFADIDGDVLTYSYEGLENGTVADNSDGTFTYTPNDGFSGEETFEIVATDPSGAEVRQSVTVTVMDVNDPPEAPAAQTVAVAEDGAQDFTVDATDPEGGELTIAFAEPENGVITDNGDGTYTYTPDADWNGSEVVTATITDAEGESVTQEITFEVAPENDAPTVDPATQSAETVERQSVEFEAAFVDIDGDTLTYSYEGLENGTVADNGDGTFTYTPDDAFSGEETFEIVAADPSGAEARQSVTVTVEDVNDPPQVAAAQTVAVAEDGTQDFTIDATDPEGDAVTISIEDPENGTVVDNGDGTYTFTPDAEWNGSEVVTASVTDAEGAAATQEIKFEVTAENDAPTVEQEAQTVETSEDEPVSFGAVFADADGDALTYSYDGLENGSVVDNGDGTFTYTPNADWNGEETFDIVATDPSGAEVRHSVSVTVNAVNDLPQLAETQNLSAGPDETVTFEVEALDPESGALIYAVEGGDDNGTVTDNGGGNFTFTPADGFSGTESFTVTVTDPEGGTATQVVTITIGENQVPVFEDVPQTVTVAEDGTDSFSFNVADPEGDNVAITVEQPENGTITDNGDGSFTYTPDADWSGTETVTVTATDPTGDTATQTLTLVATAVNDAPSVTPTQTVTGEEDVPVDFTADFADVDDTELDYSFQNVANGSVVRNADGSFTFTPDANFNGTTSFDIVAADDEGETATQTVTIELAAVNDAPTVEATQSVSTAAGDAVIIDIGASDLDGDALDYAIAGGDDNGSVVDNGDGTVTYTPADGFSGDEEFTVTVTDPSGATATQTVTVSVTEPNEAPTALASQYVLTDEDLDATFWVNVEDPDGDDVTFTVSGLDESAGTVVNNGGPSFTFNPDAGFEGTTSFDITADDGRGGTVTQTITVEVDPDVEVVHLTGGNYDRDPGNPVAYNADGGRFLFVQNYDPDGATWAVIDNFSNDDQLVAVTGDRGFNPPLVSYRATNSPSVLHLGPEISMGGGSHESLVVLENTIDESVNWVDLGLSNDSPDELNQNFGYTAVRVEAFNPPPSPPEDEVSFIAVENRSTVFEPGFIDPQNEELTYSFEGVDGEVVDNGDGTFTFTPEENFSGTEEFTITATDPAGGSASTTATVTVLGEDEVVFLDEDSDENWDTQESFDASGGDFIFVDDLDVANNAEIRNFEFGDQILFLNVQDEATFVSGTNDSEQATEYGQSLESPADLYFYLGNGEYTDIILRDVVPESLHAGFNVQGTDVATFNDGIFGYEALAVG